MDPERYEVWIAGADGGPLWERAAQAGVHTVPIRDLRREIAPIADLRVLLRLVRLIRRERFSIVHAHNAKAGFLGRLAARLCGTPVVLYTLHGRDPWWPIRDGSAYLHETMSRPTRGLFLLLERSLRRVTVGFIAVAPTVARQAVEARVARPGAVDVVPSAVELETIPRDADPNVRQELGIPRDAPLVGTVGRLDPQKAPHDFIRMAGLVAAARPEARFVMVGEGELAGDMRTEADRLGVRVIFTGFRSDAARVASAFDVYVVSSVYEGLGRALTEAMASGRPIVATAVDGVVDVIEPGATGLLVAPRDPRGLADAVGWMLSHPNEAERMGDAGRTLVRRLFAPASMCAVLDEVYGRYLGFSPSAPAVSAAKPVGSSAGSAIRGSHVRRHRTDPSPSPNGPAVLRRGREEPAG
jgi:glycosyltransferase involved in cell wall biosynthesis